MNLRTVPCSLPQSALKSDSWRKIPISLIDRIVSIPQGLSDPPPPLRVGLASFPDVPGGSHCKDTLISAGEKHPFQKPTTLIVQEVFVPSILDKLGYDHDDAAGGMFFRKIQYELNDGNDDKAVG